MSRSLDSYNGTGLIRAADRGYTTIVARLLETDIDVDHVNRLGWTALLEAIILGGGDEAHTEVVRQLVEAGVDVNLADGQGVTPLAHAEQSGYDEMATILRAGRRDVAKRPSALQAAAVARLVDARATRVDSLRRRRSVTWPSFRPARGALP